MNKALLLETLRAVRPATIRDREKLDVAIAMVESWKPTVRKKRTLEKKKQEFMKIARCFGLIGAKIEALNKKYSYKPKPAIYDLAVTDVAKDMKMNKSVLKKKLPEYMFYLREPIENVPQHMRRHVEKAKERWNERWRRFFVGKRVIDLDGYLNLDAVLQKPYLLGAVGPPHSWEVMLDILTWSGRRKVAEVYDHTSGQPRNEFRKKY